MQKNKRTYLLLLALCMVGFWLFDNLYSPATYSDPVEGEEFRSELLPERLRPDAGGRPVINHNYYQLAYDEATEQAAWVAYILKPEHLSRHDRERPYFIEDPFVRSKSADWRNYRGSGYDRGHLVPAGDRRFSEQAYNETFYTSNISPQDREFNAGIWNELEQQVRRWCRRYGTLYVITGGVLEKDLPAIGDEDVAVPEYFYKIVYREVHGDPGIISFLIPNKDSRKPLSTFTVTVDSLEVLTGIDFFPNLEQEAQLERSLKKGIWKFN